MAQPARLLATEGLACHYYKDVPVRSFTMST